MQIRVPLCLALAASLVGVCPAAGRTAGIDPDALTVADFAFMPAADDSFVEAYRLFLKARAGDQEEGQAVPTYGQAARAFLTAAEGAAEAGMRSRCLWLAALCRFLDMDLPGAAQTSAAVLGAAERSHPRETALAREIIARVDAGQITEPVAMIPLMAGDDGDATEPPPEAAVVEGLAAILERSAQTREARAALTAYDLRTRLPEPIAADEQLRAIAVLACFFGEMSVSVSENRRKLEQALCVANLRHLGVALHLHAQDHEGRFPEAYDAANRQVWQFKILPYTGDSSWSGRGAVWRCPSCDPGGFSYGINQSISIYSQTSGVRGDRARILRPHETVLLADSVHYMPGDYPHRPNYGGAAYKVHAPKEHSGTGTIDWNRHGGGANVLFVDGRVEWRRPATALEWTGR